jgi:hypothetical protein
VGATGKEIVIVTEEKETAVIVDVGTEVVKVGVGVPLLISVLPSAQRGTEVKAKVRLISFQYSYFTPCLC